MTTTTTTTSVLARCKRLRYWNEAVLVIVIIVSGLLATWMVPISWSH